MKIRTTEFSVCSDCLIAIANDDYSGMDEETALDVQHGIRSLEIIEDGRLVADGDELGFSTRACECCHGLAGNRFKATMVHHKRR